MRNRLKALPTMFQIGFSEAVAYRAEMVVWVLGTTMPFIMLMVWTTVAPVPSLYGRTWETSHFVAYFLSVFIVRQLVSSWAAWEINYEVRQGKLSMRLLKPVHPVLMYMVENLAFAPLRIVVTMPVFLALLFTPHLTSSWEMWLLFLLSIAGGWMIHFFVNIAIGAFAFTMESSVKLMDVWLACFMVFSGYLFPLGLLPSWLSAAIEWMPFRYLLGLPVELMLGVHTFPTALALLARQWAWAVTLLVASMGLWRFGVRRFQAFGG